VKDASIYGPIIGALGTIIGFVFGILKVQKQIKTDRDEENKEVLKQARAFAAAKVKESEQKMEKEIALLKQEQDNTKEIYRSEIHTLSEKIEDLRDELRRSNEKVIDLLKEALTGINK